MYQNRYNVAYIYATQVFEIRELKATSFDGGRPASVHTESICVLCVYIYIQCLVEMRYSVYFPSSCNRKVEVKKVERNI